jgi:signal transduction histidine kinase
MMDRVRI